MIMKSKLLLISISCFPNNSVYAQQLLAFPRKIELRNIVRKLEYQENENKMISEASFPQGSGPSRHLRGENTKTLLFASSINSTSQDKVSLETTKVPSKPTKVPMKPSRVPTLKKGTSVPFKPSIIPLKPSKVPRNPTNSPEEPNKPSRKPTKVPTTSVKDNTRKPTKVSKQPTKVSRKPTKVPTTAIKVTRTPTKNPFKSSNPTKAPLRPTRTPLKPSRTPTKLTINPSRVFVKFQTSSPSTDTSIPTPSPFQLFIPTRIPSLRTTIQQTRFLPTPPPRNTGRTCPTPESPSWQALADSSPLMRKCFQDSDCIGYMPQDGPACCSHPYCICSTVYANYQYDFQCLSF